MSCRTNNARSALKHKTELPSFDRYFQRNAGFVRPIRKGQAKPVAPDDTESEGKQYLVQDLDGNWLSRQTVVSPLQVFADIQANDGSPHWMH